MPFMALPSMQKLELPDRINTDRYGLAAGDEYTIGGILQKMPSFLLKHPAPRANSQAL